MNLEDEQRVRELILQITPQLIVAAAGEGMTKAIRTAETRVLPARVVNPVGAGSPIARVIMDGDTFPIEVQNTTNEALSEGARVLVLFFPPHGAVILGGGAPFPGGTVTPGTPWGWSFGPLAHHSVYDFDVEYFLKAVTLNDGSIVTIIQSTGSTAYVRLKPPYQAWFSMWDAPYDMGQYGEVQAVRNNAILIGGDSLGAGGQLYHGPLDLGSAGMTGNGGPGAGARDPYGPWDVSVVFSSDAWDTNLGGWYETFLTYFASAVDLNLGRVWQVGRRDANLPGCFSGFLDVPDGDVSTPVTQVSWIRTADLPAGAGADTRIEGHSMTVDSQGNLYVGGGSDTAVVENRFRRYVPGPPVAGGISEVQRFQETDAPGWLSYQLAFPTTAFSSNVTITEGDNTAAIQASFDAWLGAGIVTIAGTDVDFTVTWTATGMQPQLCVVNNGAGNTIVVTVNVHGDGYPSTDTWTELTVIPGPFCYRGSMAVDQSDRVYYAGGIDAGGVRLSTLYRYTPDTGWATMADIPGGYVTASVYNATTGEAQPALMVGASLCLLVYAPDDSLTRLAIFDTIAETWLLSPPCVTNHQRGGFAYAGGYFWAIAGGNPVDSTMTAIVEKIPLP